MASRWMAALLLGARQGELLGLTWDRADIPNRTLDLSWQLQRIPFRHGCGGSCRNSRAGSCPERILDVQPDLQVIQLDGGLCLKRPKSTSGVRMLPLPDPLAAALLLHREQATGPNPHDLVWRRLDGRPIDPTDDSAAWHQALATAEVPDVELHAARHTAATLLLESGVPSVVIASVLGHSDVVVTGQYTHVDLSLARTALDGLGRELTA